MIEKRLGRGLETLITRTSPTESGPDQVVEIELDAIVANPSQPRQIMDESALEGLSRSILRHGVLQPVVVQRAGAGYQLVVGERRVRASRLAGKTTVPAIVVEVDEQRSLEMAIIENIQRENLTALEEASAYEALIARNGWTHQEVAEHLGKARATVSNTLRLLELPDGVKALVQGGSLSAGQARALLGSGTEAEIESLADRIVKDNWSVRDVETHARALKGKAAKRRKRAAKPTPMGSYEEKLRQMFGTRVTIRDAGGKGEVRFEFYSAEDRDRLLHQLMTGQAPD